MSNPTLSIIIPTHKRAPILKQCLDAIGNQTCARKLEVVVICDGHDPETVEMLTNYRTSVPIQFLEIEKSQQGTARNRGAKAAMGAYTLIIGDDIFLDPEACANHIRVHRLYENQPQRTMAVLGHTTWDPDVGITPAMEWLEKSGWQFGYPQIEQYAQSTLPKEIQHRFCYTSHISLPTDTLRSIPFREDIDMYGWEDIEWGMKLKDAGIEVHYEPSAKALHHHKLEMEDSLERMRILGISAKKIQDVNPAFDRVPKGMKRVLYRITALLPTMAGRHRKAFLKGLKA